MERTSLGLHVGINIIAEIRGSVFRRHFKEESVVFCVGPVKILGNRICRDRILEASSVGIAFNHDFNEGFVDHIHFLLAVLIKEIHFFTAHHGRKLRQVVGTVQSRVILENGAWVPQRLGVFTP